MSSDELAIRVKNLSKCYHIYSRPSDRLRQALVPRFHSVLQPARRLLGNQDIPAPRFFRDFWALRAVSFEVRRGETLGVIGRNGSGKSTLLQLIAGTLAPTTGTVETSGNIAALLELGSGFNPEFTGRDNVFLNGSILGMSRKQIESRFDEIAAFADIGAFLDQPVKTYSSGMVVRLAFAVQAFSDPEILIVDEALSVGDVFFQQKCFDHVRRLIARGTTLLFVSHDTAAVQNLCSRALLLREGEAVFDGPPEEAASRYYEGSRLKVPMASFPASRSSALTASAGPQLNELKDEILSHNILPQARSRHGNGRMEIVATSFVNEKGLHSLDVALLGSVRISTIIRAKSYIADPSAGFHLFDRMNNLVFAAGTRQLRVRFDSMQPNEERVLTFTLGLSVQPGPYTFNVGCSEASEDGPNVGVISDRWEGLGPIVVYADEHRVWPFYGIAQLPLTISIQ